VQHVAESHLPIAQTVLPSFAEKPSEQVKLLQVGGGGAGVVVTVVMTTAQHVAKSH